MSSSVQEGVAIAQAEDTRRKIVEERSNSLEDYASQLQRLVYKSSNPDPYYVAVIIVITLLLGWVVYIYYFKPNASGVWYDNNDKKWVIDHDRWSDGAIADIEGRGVVKCDFVNNVARCNDVLGIWNYDDIIVFMDGITLTKVKNASN